MFKSLLNFWNTKFNTQIEAPITDSFQNQVGQFSYVKKISKKNSGICNAVAIHPNQAFMIAGHYSKIKLLCLVSKNGSLKLLQKLSENQGSIGCLKFFSKSDQFISTGVYEQIINWTKDPNFSWVVKQTLLGHHQYISKVLLNEQENLLITSSADNTIKFWSNNQGWKCNQTISVHKGEIYDISLSDSDTKLISCGIDKLILIMGKLMNDEWVVIQKMVLSNVCTRLTFISENLFTAQPEGKEQALAFEFDSESQRFKQKYMFSIKQQSEHDLAFFPQQYIKAKQILITKAGKYVNLVQIKQNIIFKTEQSIVFDTLQTFGTMSQNGNLLVTWDKLSQQFQIRKYRKN